MNSEENPIELVTSSFFSKWIETTKDFAAMTKIFTRKMVTRFCPPNEA